MLLVLGWGEVMLVPQIHLLESLFGLEGLMDGTGWCLEFVVLLVVRTLRENRFQRCRVLALVVLA